MTPFPLALRAWRDALGDEHVVTTLRALRAAERATFATTQRIPAILRPGSRRDVQACLRIARKYGVAVYPTSGGKNWGFGSRVPVTDGCALLDLGRMNRIVEYDERLAYMVVQPGVTFRQAHAFLTKRGGKLLLNTVGGSPEASLVANALERGHGATPYHDRWGAVCGLEVVLPDGTVVYTGGARFRKSRTRRVQRGGVGPYVDGLFSQSNLGVVTELTLWLWPRPAHVLVASASVHRAKKLAPLVEAFRPLCLDERQDTLLVSHGSLVSKSRARGAPPLEGFGADSWHLNAAFYCSDDDDLIAREAACRRALEPVVDRLSLHLVDRGPFFGEPSETAARRAYVGGARRRAGKDLDLDRDGCGVMWLAPALPFSGRDVERVAKLCRTVIEKHGFEFEGNFKPASFRCIDAFVPIFYDRAERGADARADACFRAGSRALHAAGYPPYRASIHGMDELPDRRGGYESLIAAIKGALDPEGTLAPGRYDGLHNRSADRTRRA
jgi:4-cresol dehydrogenase (hydroxylating) flavoprotein subunit